MLYLRNDSAAYIFAFGTIYVCRLPEPRGSVQWYAVSDGMADDTCIQVESEPNTPLRIETINDNDLVYLPIIVNGNLSWAVLNSCPEYFEEVL